MSSYGSNHSGYHHPSQYPPNPQAQQMHPQPPYPTTPGPQQTSNQPPQAFYPPTPQQQYNQPAYSSSPASPWQQPTYSSSPQQQYQRQYPITSHPPPPSHRRTSSSSSSHPHFPHTTTAPISIPTSSRNQHIFARPPSYSRSHGSHHSHHIHDHHAFGDGEDGEQYYGGLDEETLREYERRYAKDRELEKRPTLGGSLMSVVRALGGKRE